METPDGVVDDPWAWLADRDDPETIAYLEAENAYADQYFAEPARAALVETVFEEIKSRVQETDLSVPVLHGGWWYVTRTIEGKSYPVFCRSRDAEVPDTPDAVILDCNAEAEGHEYFDVHAVEPSPDHALLAWSSDIDGSERYTLRVRDLATGEDLRRDPGTSSWGGVAWSADDDWLFYARPDDQMRPYEIWRHRLGTSPADDVLVLSEDDERFFLDVSSTRSGRWIVIAAASKTSGESLRAPGRRSGGLAATVRPRTPDVEYGIDDWGDRFVVLTNLDAPDFRLMTAPHDDPGSGRTSSPMKPAAGSPPPSRSPTTSCCTSGSRRSRGFGSCAATATPKCSTSVTNRTTSRSAPIRSGTTTTLRLSLPVAHDPASVFDHDLATGERMLRKQTPTPGVDLAAYVAERTWATAADGAAVPVDVVRHRRHSARRNGAMRRLRLRRLRVLDGAVVQRRPSLAARPRRRLGARPPPWRRRARPVVVSRRQAAEQAQHVHRHARRVRPPRRAGFADGARIALRGGSAGGLLVGACVTMRPERFAAAVAEVPFVDVVTTMSDPSLPLTVTEWEEWGDPRAEPFASYIARTRRTTTRWPPTSRRSSSPPGSTTRVVSYHEPAKWVARLRSVGAGPARPLVLRTRDGRRPRRPQRALRRLARRSQVVTFLLSSSR